MPDTAAIIKARDAYVIAHEKAKNDAERTEARAAYEAAVRKAVHG